jgi:hypothetical protein
MADNKELRVIFTIKNSPHKYISLNISNTFTVGDFKKIIIDKYNEQNSSDEMIILSSKEICDKLNLLDDRCDIYDYALKNGITYISFEIINHNIYKRLKKGIIKFDSFIGLSCAYFKYVSQNGKYDEIKKEGIIPFQIINIIKTEGKFVAMNIKLLKPMLLCFGFGPSEPQSYYRLNSNGNFGIYYQQSIKDDNSYKEYKFSSEEEFLKNGVCHISCNAEELKWNVLDKCAICKKNNSSAMFTPCNHINSCDECALKLNKCPQCNDQITNRGKMIPIQYFMD